MMANDRRNGFIGRHAQASLVELWKLVEGVKASSHSFYLLRDATRLYGIYEANDPEQSLTEERLRDYAEGRIFNESMEIRWRKLIGIKKFYHFDILILSEERITTVEPIGKEWRIDFYQFSETTDDGDLTSAGKLWNRTESRLPISPQYPDTLLLSYAVYCDAENEQARFTRLVAKRKKGTKGV